MENKETPSTHNGEAQVDKKQERKETILLYLHDFVIWLVAILLIFLLLFRVVVVSGPSMNDTLVHGDYLLLLNNVLLILFHICQSPHSLAQ